jgi:diguanylate cyclase (GGDEF)-like protein
MGPVASRISTDWIGRGLLGAVMTYAAWELHRAARTPLAVVVVLSLPLLLTGVRGSRRLRRDLSAARREIADRETELATLHALGLEVVTSLRPERVFATLERGCRKVFDFDGCLVALADPASGELRTAFRHRRRRTTEFDARFPVEGLFGWARQARRGTRIDDLAQLPDDTPFRGEWLAPGTRSLLAVPLLVGAEVVGVLTLQSERVAAWDDRALALLATIAQQAAIALESARRHERATVDSLTGLYVRDHFFARLADEDERARRYGGGFALLMADLDGFKDINDRHGHLAGDRFLREIAETLRQQLRAADVACRFGGDEFCLLLPQTGADGARTIAERIRSAIARRVVSFEGLALRSTVSIGFAVYPEHDGGDLQRLLRKADEALYRAKRAGRDRVVPFAA